MDLIKKIQDQLPGSVISDTLVYNTCWEDPQLDRQLLDLTSDSRIIMITSAGCNALDYLLDHPRKIDCVDINPAQNALLELKKALFKNKNFQLLWDFFGSGSRPESDIIYQQKLRELLPTFAEQYWNRYIGYFVPTSDNSSFYFQGTTGNVARLIQNRVWQKGFYPEVLKMLNADSLEEQTYYFDEIEPQLWDFFSKWLIRQEATMKMLGVPLTQRNMIEEEYQNGMLGFIRQSLRQVFTERPLQNNYFWQVYLTGSYRPNCCPNYLKESNFDTLNQQIDKIHTHTSSLLNFLKQNSESYTHFVLLDHQDWMADAQPDLLAEEWKLMLSKSQSGTKILFRSAGSSLNFLPDFVFNHVDFQPKKTQPLHQKDRVGTYESTHLAVVQ